MNLREFLDQMPPRGGSEFAERCGVRPYSYLLAFASGNRHPSPKLAVVIERESNYMVMRWELRPDDWHLIWPELKYAKNAPPIPSTPSRSAAFVEDEGA